MSTYKDSPYVAYSRRAQDGTLLDEVRWADMTYERLAWNYGHNRAAFITSGRDPATQLDLAAWRRICARAS